jgi:hypothetical protein
MMKLQKFNDDSHARAYLLGKLSFGYKVVAALIGKVPNLAAGTLSVILPDSVKADEILEFRWELPEADHTAAIGVLAELVKRFISNSGRTVLLHDHTNAPSDPGWETYKFAKRAVLYNNELCWELKGTDISPAEITELLSDWSSYSPVSAFFCASSPSEQKNDLTTADMTLLADNLVGVTVDAFDADSFVIWWREDLCPFPMSQIS